MGREFQWTGVPPTCHAHAPSGTRARRDRAQHQAVLCAGALLALLLARWERTAFAAWSRQPSIALRYPDRTVQVPRGWSVLEASRSHGIAHLSICGGARCSTCCVRVVGAGRARRPAGPRRAAHARARARAGRRAPGLPAAPARRHRGHAAVRATAQARAGPRAVRQLRRASATWRSSFVDLRRWSGLSERQWPFDLAYVLDRYFATVGAAVRESRRRAQPVHRRQRDGDLRPRDRPAHRLPAGAARAPR